MGSFTRFHSGAVIASFVIAMTLLNSGMTYLLERLRDVPDTFGRIFLATVVIWSVWGLLIPVVVRLATRFPLGRTSQPGHVAIHLFAAAACSALVSLVSAGTNSRLYPTMAVAPYGEIFWQHALYQAPMFLMVYLTVIGLHAAVRHFRQSVTHQQLAAALEVQLVQAQLHTLRLRLQPHFLFNTLHAVGALVDESPPVARTMITLLGDLLRCALENDQQDEVTLREELHLLHLYLEIERIRFQDRLFVEIDVAPALQDAIVPVFILQPLVENAIRHGTAAQRGHLHVRIHGYTKAESLMLDVWNSNSSLARPAVVLPGNRLGVATTRERLRKLYGDDASFELVDHERGVLATVRQPLRVRPTTDGVLLLANRVEA